MLPVASAIPLTMASQMQIVRFLFVVVLISIFNPLVATELESTPVYSVAEVQFAGPPQNATDSPAREISLVVTFRHESGTPELKLHGFFDGDGRGGIEGRVFKVRFCPTKSGRWNIVEAASNVLQEAAFWMDHDLVADLILCGPDTPASRATLAAAHNRADATPYLRYIAARYGSYPNVWLCLCNEFDIKEPKYTEIQIADFGGIIQGFLAYPTPLSVHTVPKTMWPPKFDRLPTWNDHIILQKKVKQIATAADVNSIALTNPAGKPRLVPVISDELSYQGAGDKHSEGDTIESHLGAFLGGGYGSTGEKRGMAGSRVCVGHQRCEVRPRC